MNQQELLLQISKYFSRFNEQVKILNANSEFSINIHAENVLIKILNIIYDCDFENANYSESKNYDSIDLRDRKGRLSIQVTATSNINKIKETLEKYIKNNRFNEYKDLKVLILTGRQKKYNQGSLNTVIKGKIVFNESTNVIDLTSLYVELNKQNDLSKILAIKELLEKQFSDTLIQTPLIELKSFEDLCNSIKPYLSENERIFESYGPNSGAKSKGPVRWDLTLWYKASREKILPNNKLISNLLEINSKLIPLVYNDVIKQFLNHVYAFEKHCGDASFDYSQYQFPKEFSIIINNGISK
jgi:hypothetical protein